jgi:tetratricopeptide (TPR) repeat protein
MSTITTLATAFSTALALLVALPACSAQVSGNVHGVLRVDHGDPPQQRVLIELQLRGQVVSSAYPDAQGRFEFDALDLNYYHLVIEHQDYYPVDELLQYNTVEVNLVPRTAVPEPDPLPKEVSGSNPHIVDLSEYTRHFPKNAIQEYRRGLKAEKHGKGRAAIKHYEKAIAIAPDFYPARNNLGCLYLSDGDFAAAQQEFERAIQSNRNAPEPYFNLAYIHLLKKDYAQAEQGTRQGLQRQPRSAFGQFVLGATLSRTGRQQEAEQALLQSLALDRSISKAHLELVYIFLLQQRTKEAMEHLKLFLKIAPNDFLAPKAQALLARLQTSTH